MVSRVRVLSDELLRPIFKARLMLYLLGVAIAIVVLVADEGRAALLPLTMVAAAVAWWQMRTSSLPQAWLFDMVFALGVAWVADTPTGLAIVVGWAAVVGLVDTERLWVYPVGVGVAAALTTALIEPEGFGWSPATLLRIVGVTSVAVFVVFMFRMVGDLLRQSERELRAFFDRVPVALTRTSADGELLEYNMAVTEMFQDVRAGESVIERYPDPEQRKAFVEALVRDGVVHNYETALRTGPDDVIKAVISANAVNDDDGKMRYIETAIFDFTSLRATELERERLALVIDSTSDLVAIGNRDGTVRYANAASRNWIREYLTDEYARIGQELPREEYLEIREALRSTGSWSGTVTIQGREGPRLVNTSLQVVDSGGDYSVASISRDVTDEIETQRQLEDLLKAKDELVASISHEIRTPLSVVLGMASELRDNYEDFDAETHREFAGHIAEQGQEMANIVEDLLVAARTDPGSIVLVKAVVDLGHELDMTTRLLPEHEYPNSLDNRANAKCWADPSRVRQILRNLMVNASRYGGERIVVTTRSDDRLVYLDIADDGPGVPEDDAAKIFEPFERAHSVGTQPASIGLGLSVSRDLARRMGGDLSYARRDGQTVFTLSLPASPPPGE